MQPAVFVMIATISSGHLLLMHLVELGNNSYVWIHGQLIVLNITVVYSRGIKFCD